MQVRDLATHTTIEDRCDILINAAGVLNQWRWPEIPGLHDFKGKLMHSASWNGEVDLRGKRVGLIGNGYVMTNRTNLREKKRNAEVKELDLLGSRSWNQSSHPSLMLTTSSAKEPGYSAHLAQNHHDATRKQNSKTLPRLPERCCDSAKRTKAGSIAPLAFSSPTAKRKPRYVQTLKAR